MEKRLEPDIGESDMDQNRTTARVVAIVVMFNSHEEAGRCVQTILDETAPGIDILVVNNGSADDSGALTRKRFQDEPRVTVADLEVNRGFSGGANAGFALALQRRPQFVWLLTDDIELAPQSADHLLSAMAQDSRIGLAGQYILDRAQPDTLYYGGGVLAPVGAIHEHRGEIIDVGQDLGPARETEFVTGASMFWRTEALMKVGPMDETFWLYWEDADLSYRTHQAGWRVVVVPNALAWHDVTSSGDPSMPLRTRYSIRNELRFLRKHGLRNTWKMAWHSIIRGLRRRLLRGDRLAGAAALGAMDHLLGRTGQIRGRW